MPQATLSNLSYLDNIYQATWTLSLVAQNFESEMDKLAASQLVVDNLPEQVVLLSCKNIIRMAIFAEINKKLIKREDISKRCVYIM